MTDEVKRSITASELEKMIGKKVAKVKTEKLTAPGDNYGSVMLSVDATLESGKDVALVAKMFPLSELTQNFFQSPTTMKKEIGVYQIISPEFDKIQEEQSVPPSERLNFFCRCPGARLSLKDGDEDQLADENSVLLLENLKVQGYRTGDRVPGLDMKHTEFALKRLAKFHATAVAIKLKKPLVFRNKIANVLTPFEIKIISKEDNDKRTEELLQKLQTIPACNRNIDALRSLFEEANESFYSNKPRVVREPYSTFMHNDFWTNNMMFRYSSETDEEPVDFKIVDFQVSMKGSPVSDIMMLLFTSTQTGIVSQHMDRFLELYHSSFVKWLRKLRCDTQQFSYEQFLEEVKSVAPLSLIHIIYILMPITYNKDQVEKFVDAEDEQPLEFNDVYISKLSEVVNTYFEKRWL